MLAALSRFRPAVPLLLRAVLGVVFIAHGFQRIEGGVQGFSQSIARLGLPAPHLFAWAAAFCEFLGGICVLIGLFTRYASLALAIVVAATRVRLHEGLIGGYEYPLVLLAVAAAVMLMGAGPISFDRDVLHRDF